MLTLLDSIGFVWSVQTTNTSPSQISWPPLHLAMSPLYTGHGSEVGSLWRVTVGGAEQSDASSLQTWRNSGWQTMRKTPRASASSKFTKYKPSLQGFRLQIQTLVINKTSLFMFAFFFNTPSAALNHIISYDAVHYASPDARDGIALRTLFCFSLV